ncbi:hypothetical protein RvY_19080 [Ramazzottius varieornatus]|uniref:Uncharacterized protein n=1 Tax=Ramazzottius varieornatus TaxID=947166 RepID=A0A1D1W862_RAMVA|nr:hypothetical protein RvY_19080 [Ramazzottius varieornatus]
MADFVKHPRASVVLHRFLELDKQMYGDQEEDNYEYEGAYFCTTLMGLLRRILGLSFQRCPVLSSNFNASLSLYALLSSPQHHLEFSM